MVTRNLIKQGLLGILAVQLNGCMQLPPPMPDDPRFAPIIPDAASIPTPLPGAIFVADSGFSLYGGSKARKVGDIITVRLVERTQASKDSATNTKKEYDATLSNPNLLGTTAKLTTPKSFPLQESKGLNLSVGVDSSTEFKGSADSSQNNSLSGDITVTVAQILPNKHLIIRGEKWITLNQGSEYIRLTGQVRPEDIGPDNMVMSTKIANARIAYAGQGALADANSPGFLARFFNSVVWPF